MAVVAVGSEPEKVLTVTLMTLRRTDVGEQWRMLQCGALKPSGPRYVGSVKRATEGSDAMS